MRRRLTLTLLSVFAVPALSDAAEPRAAGSHLVAPEPHAAEPEPETAQAQSSATDEAAAPALREEWYGWQSLSTDGAALLLLIAASASSDLKSDVSSVLGYSSLGVYLLGGPVTHFAHDNPGRGLGSLALRAGLPIAFGTIGYYGEDCSGGDDYDLCGIVGALLGGVLGIATAVTVDAAVLGYEEVPIEREGLQNVGVSVTRDVAVIMAGGSF
jgi:hypothetical protein